MKDKINSVRSQSQIYGEAAVCVVFVVVSAMGALYLLDLIKLTPAARLWTGRVLAAFSVLALMYLSYKANSKKG